MSTLRKHPADIDVPLMRWRRWSLRIGLAAAAVCAVAGFFDTGELARAGLFAVVFWIMLTLGCLALAMLHHLSHGRWGGLTLRVFEATFATLPMLALLFVPVAWQVRLIYSWAMEASAGTEHLGRKAAYLNVDAFQIRAAAYGVVWITMAFVLAHWSRRRDRAPAGRLDRRLARLSSFGLIVLTLTGTFASIDWIMSLEPDWYSTIYGAMVVLGAILGAMSFAILVATSLENVAPLRDYASPQIWNDLGNLLLAFLMLWAYVTFSQFLIIWSGDLPREASWYATRLSHGWQYLALGIVLFQFAIPFCWLLSRDAKRTPGRLAKIAAVVLMMRLPDWCWTVVPALDASGFASHWLTFPAFIAVGGVWTWIFCISLVRHPIIPVGDPVLANDVEHSRPEMTHGTEFHH